MTMIPIISIGRPSRIQNSTTQLFNSETSNNTEDFYSLAAQAPHHFVVFVVNTGDETLKVNIEGLPAGDYTHIQTTEVEPESPQENYEVPSEMVSLEIPGNSIHILTTASTPRSNKYSVKLNEMDVA